MLLSIFELAAVKMQAGDVQMTDGLLRKLLIGLIFAKYALEPTQCLAEISAKAGRKREVVGHEPNVMFVRQLLGKLECNSKLLLCLAPVPEHDMAKPACIRTLQKCFRRLRNEGLGLLEKSERVGMLAAATRETCERMKSLRLTGRISRIVQQLHGASQQAR